MSVMASPNLTSSDGTTAQFGIGDIYVGANGNTWQYCKATAATIAAYSALSGASPAAVEEATTTTATALGTAGGWAGIAQFAVAASEYFWALVGPFYLQDDGTTFKVLAANVTAGNLLYSTATDGVLDDSSGGSTIPLRGLTLTETVTTQEAADCTSFRKLGWLV